MEKKKEKKISKSISYWLRHSPEDIGITIEDNGWTDVKVLIEKAKHKVEFTLDELKCVVDNSDKQRFSFSEDLTKIRANQGHSIDVKIEFEEVKPPRILYHGAPEKSVDAIMKSGLNKMKRHHVHLSPSVEVASQVGARRGKFVILEVEAMRLRADGHKIYISQNGVYLVDEVPPGYIKLKR